MYKLHYERADYSVVVKNSASRASGARTITTCSPPVRWLAHQ